MQIDQAPVLNLDPGRSVQAPAELVVIRPRRLEHGRAAIGVLRCGGTVVLDVAELKPVVAQRLVDLCCGAAVALAGQVRPLVRGVFLFTPAAAPQV